MNYKAYIGCIRSSAFTFESIYCTSSSKTYITSPFGNKFRNISPAYTSDKLGVRIIS